MSSAVLINLFGPLCVNSQLCSPLLTSVEQSTAIPSLRDIATLVATQKPSFAYVDATGYRDSFFQTHDNSILPHEISTEPSFAFKIIAKIPRKSQPEPTEVII